MTIERGQEGGQVAVKGVPCVGQRASVFPLPSSIGTLFLPPAMTLLLLPSSGPEPTESQAKALLKNDYCYYFATSIALFRPLYGAKSRSKVLII